MRVLASTASFRATAMMASFGGFAVCDEAAIEGLHVGIESRGREGGEIEHIANGNRPRPMKRIP